MFFPPTFALYMAMWALRMSSSALTSHPLAIPMLAVIEMTWPASSNGEPNTSITRAAMSSGGAWTEWELAKMTNSSSPNLQTVSSLRMAPANRLATATSSSSPA